tara:strand:- start:4731 stop:4937 length:207 start_codon:yes stop_codon:yes gene_type:complete
MENQMTIKFNDEELTLLETITRESLNAFISESSKATGAEYIARCVDQIKVYKSLHDKAQGLCLERGSE